MELIYFDLIFSSDFQNASNTCMGALKIISDYNSSSKYLKLSNKYHEISDSLHPLVHLYILSKLPREPGLIFHVPWSTMLLPKHKFKISD